MFLNFARPACPAAHRAPNPKAHPLHAPLTGAAAILTCASLAACGAATQEDLLPEPTVASQSETASAPTSETTPAETTSTETTTASATTSESTSSTAPTSSETNEHGMGLKKFRERDAEDFNIGYPGSYQVLIGGSRCSQYDHRPEGVLSLSCKVSLTGDIPPVEVNAGPAGQLADVVMWTDGHFATSQETGGGDVPPQYAPLERGEQVVIDETKFTHKPDGTLRIERSGSWFEISPDGQYSSDTYSPNA